MIYISISNLYFPLYHIPDRYKGTPSTSQKMVLDIIAPLRPKTTFYKCLINNFVEQNTVDQNNWQKYIT